MLLYFVLLYSTAQVAQLHIIGPPDPSTELLAGEVRASALLHPGSPFHHLFKSCALKFFPLVIL
jgi:hypothetical protein